MIRFVFEKDHWDCCVVNALEKGTEVESGESVRSLGW